MNDEKPAGDAEQSLTELARSLQESQRIAGIGSYVLDLSTMTWSSSDVLDEIFGIGPEHHRTVAGWLAVIHPDDREMMSSHFEDAVRFRSKFDKEYRIVRLRDRAQCWVHGCGVFECDERGRPIIMRGTIQDITERKQVEAELRQNEELLNLFVQHAPAALAMLDREMRYIAVSRRWLESYGLRGREIIGHSHYDIFPEIPARWVAIHRRALGGETLKSDEDPFERADGSIQWLRWEIRPWLTGTGAIGGIVIFTEDITARRNSEDRLRLAASVFTHASEGIMIADPGGKILDVNDAFTRITGYTRKEAVGQSTNLLRSGRHGREFYDNLWRDLSETGHWSGEIWNRAKDGRVFAEMLTITAVRGKSGEIERFVALFSDITASKEQEQTLRRVTEYDILTGLPNRSLLRERLHIAMLQAARRGSVLAVVCLDLDNFKRINDVHGHAAGDEVLTRVAHSMKLAMRESDILSRLGGDEFIAVISGLDNPDASLPTIKHLLNVASQTVNIGGKASSLSASAGVAFYPQSEEVDPDQLLRQAAQALYQSKLEGKNRYHIFDSHLDLSVRGHHEDLERVRRALAENEFVLFYQPKMNLATGAIHGAEALIRWKHPERGLLLPSQFLPIVEGHALVLEIGEWVIRNVLEQMEAWKAAGLDIPVSVNISAQQLQHPDFSAHLHHLLSAHQSVNPSRLEIEVLESTAVPDMAQVSQVIHTCGKLGVSFALDDFGTGYSSLAYLKRLPVDVLKIDQTFVHDMLDDPEDLTIVEGMLGLASAFRREAIAEGVETVEQGVLLLRLGCKIAQGFGIAAPMPPGDLPGWLASWTPDPQWLKISALDPADRPLLYASAEHSAWVGAIEAYLHGTRRVRPSLEATQCRLGSWMNLENPATAGRITLFRDVATVHRELHTRGTEIMVCKDRGCLPEALERLPELRALRDQLLSELRELLQRD